jgi:ABC-type Fe2+-enterobactin transport system substrate-binding protein
MSEIKRNLSLYEPSDATLGQVGGLLKELKGVGPKPNGQLPELQERCRQVAAQISIPASDVSAAAYEIARVEASRDGKPTESLVNAMTFKVLDHPDILKKLMHNSRSLGVRPWDLYDHLSKMAGSKM